MFGSGKINSKLQPKLNKLQAFPKSPFLTPDGCAADDFVSIDRCTLSLVSVSPPVLLN